MQFNSLQYFLFLPAVYLIYYFAGARARWFILLAASFMFYAALNVPYLLIVLALVALTAYGFGIWLNYAESENEKQVLLWSGITTNILILVSMKYLPFLSENLRALFGILSLNVQIQPIKTFVAIGVSFYVFQAVSYLVDVYLEIVKPERHFGYFVLYLSFFPKLLQGPIERAGDLLPQLKRKYEFNYDNMRFGMLMFAWGLFKKIVIADQLGLYVDAVYKDVHAFTGLPLLLATYGYAFQIYMDFSGYTDMALGSAKLFNINLTQNFNSPYLATSVADFWRRWHISFSRWILDYIFKPLQMKWRNYKTWGAATALIVTFLVSGLWHGASWGFVIWGGMHGLYMACSVFYKPYQKKLYNVLGVLESPFLRAWQIFMTFNLLCFAWIFFRARSLSDAMYVVFHMVTSGKDFYSSFLLGDGQMQFPLMVVSVSIFVFFATTVFRQNGIDQFKQKSAFYRYFIYSSLLSAIFLLAKYSGTKSFIYFQF